jgi:aminoglycoside/choline kinase family phosphotransferase
MIEFVKNYFGEDKLIRLETIAKAGSDREYARAFVEDKTYIICESSNIKENETFFNFSKTFAENNLPTPIVLSVNSKKTIYIQDDFGDVNLLSVVIEKGYTDEVKNLYKKAITSLAKLQIQSKINYDDCFLAKQFDHYAVLADLNYFKYYFLDFLPIEYNKYELNKEFEQLSFQIEKIEPHYFMYRDFQGRNIMIKNEIPYFIDFQGGMKGPIQYDLASLLWQAKAQLPAEWKNELLHFYMKEVSTMINISKEEFANDYATIVLIRLLQVLGAYGLRGVIENRPHFLSSIPQGLENILEWKQTYELKNFPILNEILSAITMPEIIQKFKS